MVKEMRRKPYFSKMGIRELSGQFRTGFDRLLAGGILNELQKALYSISQADFLSF